MASSTYIPASIYEQRALEIAETYLHAIGWPCVESAITNARKALGE